MTPQELRELDEWLSEHVLNVQSESWYCGSCRDTVRAQDVIDGDIHNGCGGVVVHDIPHPTTHPAAALEVLAKCVEECKADSVDIEKTAKGWSVGGMFLGADWEISPCAEAETLPLCISLFARALFAGQKGKA